MQNEIYFQAINSILLLGGFLFVVFYLLKKTAVDSYRQSLFTLRDGLFDEARNGKIEFSNPAYQFLREQMNAQIRFSHKNSIWLLLGVMPTYLKYEDIYKAEIEEMMSKVMEGLTDEQTKLINSYNDRSDDLFFKYILFFSPEFIPIILVAIPVVLLLGYISRIESIVINSNKTTIHEAALV